MRNSILCLCLFIGLGVHAEVHMTRINPALVIHNPETDFDQISVQDEKVKRGMVEKLFNADLLDHFGTKAYAVDADFSTYYTKQKDHFWLIDMNADSVPEIVFSGYTDPTDDREYFEVYLWNDGSGKRLCREVGHLLAYKVNSNTNEVLLYHHQYPCCSNASHNLNRLRLIKGKLQQLRSYFLGKEKDMVGPFLPKSSTFTGKYKTSKNAFKLNWSPAIVRTNAWIGRSNSNQIAGFDRLTVYVELAREKDWRFILVKNAPVPENGNRVINTSNFTSTYIYGWVREKDLNH